MRGRAVRMPHNNRVSSSEVLKTNDIWSKTIGYDPYKESKGTTSDSMQNSSSMGNEQTEGLMLLARLNNVKNGAESRGGCLKCGQLGHFAFQCRNAPLSQVAISDSSDSDSSSESDSEASEALQMEKSMEKSKDEKHDSDRHSSKSKSKDKVNKSDRKHSKSYKSHKHKSKHSSRDRHDKDRHGKEKKHSKKSSSKSSKHHRD